MGQSKPELQKLGGQQLPPQKRRPPAPGQARQRRLAPGQAFPSRYEIKTSFSLQGFCGSSRAKLRALERARAGSRAGPFQFRLSCHAAGLDKPRHRAPRNRRRLASLPPHTGAGGPNALQGAQSLGVQRSSSGPVSFRTQGSSKASRTDVHPPSHAGEGPGELSDASFCWTALICFLA